MEIFAWIGIVFCLSQSAMFSGLNLAFFSVTRLRLEIEAASNNKAAEKVLAMRADSNFLLATILWGNVGINVLLTLLSNSVMAGLSAFLFSTFVITLMGEIIPQAYFSRHALKMASLLAPVLRFYQLLMYPVAKPSALMLDVWLGRETIQYYKEKALKQLIHQHVAGDGDVDYVEGIGAINFLSIDDLMVSQEGEPIDPDSIISLDFKNNEPVFPQFEKQTTDVFLAQIHRSRRKWVVITDSAGTPRNVLDADGFIRSALLDKQPTDPKNFTHTPIVITDAGMPLGEVLQQLRVESMHHEDDVIDQDLILVWGDRKQIITGADILGRLMRGITNKLNKYK